MTTQIADINGATKLPRGAKRAAATRAKLLRAAMELMGERGMDNVTIGDITDRAEVAVGSFYNHFGTREALQQAVLRDMVGAFGEGVDQLHDQGLSPVEVMCAAARLAYRRAMADRTWGWFLIRSNDKGGLVTRGLGRRLHRDLERANEQGLITLPNLDHMAIGIAGLVLNFISAGLHGELDDCDGTAVGQTLLIAIGVAPATAIKIAAMDLPYLEGASDG